MTDIVLRILDSEMSGHPAADEAGPSSDEDVFELYPFCRRQAKRAGKYRGYFMKRTTNRHSDDCD